MASVETLKEQFEVFLTATDEIRHESERARDYFDGYQWTEEEMAILKARKQAPIVNNRIKPKIETLREIERKTRTDPKAYARTPQHDKEAEAITDALRFVSDNNDFDQVASLGFEYLAIEGTEACIIENKKKPNGEKWIEINPIHWDRFYYDPSSREWDFSDASYMGIALWMDLDDAKLMFPGSADDLEASMSQDALGETFDDRPLWVDKKRKRVRVLQHYYKEGEKWHYAFFSGSSVMKGPGGKKLQGLSPDVDEFGEPICPIEAASCYIDRNNNRYGHVRELMDLQDEVNHRRSKLLWMLSNRTVIADAGAVNDIHAAKRELAKADGYVELNPQAERFDINTNTDLATGQLEVLQEAKNEIDGKGPNESLQGQGPAESGRARLARQNSGLLETGTFFDRHRAWKRNVYRQAWYRIKQYWTEERWVRVTDDERNTKFVALNQQVTKGQVIQERFGEIPQVAQMDPRINEVFETRNEVSRLDVDIILAEAPDVLTIQQEQFEVIAQLAQAYPQQIPFEVVLELSALRNKDQILERIKGNEQQQAQAQQMAMQQAMQTQALEQAEKMAEIQKDGADAAKTRAETIEILQKIRQMPIEAFQKLQELQAPQG